MFNRIWFGLVIIVVIGASIGFSFFSNEDGTQTDKKNNKKENSEKKYPLAPDFELSDLDGNTVRLSEYRGKVVIIDFWATWCGPCRIGIPDFVDLQDEYGTEDFAILGISVDEGESPVVAEFARHYKINYPILHDTPEVRAAYGGIRAIPTTFIVDRDGYVRQYIQGYRPKTFFKQAINILL
jgi:cytochrome c biogenesis protein CcmG/thiol:disulfide interchange protein DsbE